VSTDLDLDTLTLAEGAHDDRSEGLCLMEAVAWFAGETHTDHPECVSPVLGAFGRELNDCLPDDKRQQLRSLIPLLPGTAGDGLDQARGLMAARWLVCEWLPAWLDLTGTASGDLRALPFGSWGDLSAAGPVVAAARAAAGAAAGAAARAAARAAAGAAAGDAARAAAGEKLAPVTEQLQDSAITLFASMITAGETP